MSRAVDLIVGLFLVGALLAAALIACAPIIVIGAALLGR
jgi:hypothetical protein